MYIFACASKKLQNNQQIDGGRILVEVEVEVSEEGVQIILWGSRREKCSNLIECFLFSAVCKS